MQKLFLLLSLTLFLPSLVFAQSAHQTPAIVDLQKQIQDLLKQIQTLQQQVTALQAELGKSPEPATPAEGSAPPPPSPEPETAPPTLTRSLSRGSSGDDVRQLQEFLAKDKSIYPDGLITGFFGPRTEAAVKKWQERHRIEAVGIIGPKTLSKFQELGRGVIQGLLEQGAGASGNIPSGLLTAPGIQKKLGTTTLESIPPAVPTGAATTSATLPVAAPVASSSTATTTPAGTIPATPAVPAVPATQTSQPATSATSATSAVPAQTTTTATTTTATTTTTSSSSASLQAPSNLTASAVAKDGAVPISLIWTDNANNEQLFELYRKLSSVNTFSLIAVYNPNTTTAPSTVQQYDSSSNVTLGASYDYYVRACASGVCSSSSNIATAVASLNTTSDTIAPSVPTNLTATTASSTQIDLSWSASTDNVGVTGYKVYRNGSYLSSVTTLSYSDTGLSAGTAYSYTVAAYDAAGNVSAQSPSVSATTISAGPPAPTNIQAVTTSSGQSQPPQMWYYLVFSYTLQSTTQSFNVYRKRPTDVSFVKYTYSAQTPVNPSILPLPGSNESNLYHRDPNQWQWWTTLPAPAPTSATGEYQFYVTAVDTSGVESSPSTTKSLKIYAAPTIISPADGSTVSAPFTITVTGDPNAPSYSTYGMALYKKITGDTAWSAWPAPSTNFTYPGPALNPSDNPHRLVVWLSANGSSFHGTSIFNISTTTSFLNLRAKNLATISQTLDAIEKKLIKLLQGF